MAKKDLEIKVSEYARSFVFKFKYDLTGFKVIMTAKKKIDDSDVNAVFKKVVTSFTSTSATLSVCTIDFATPDLDLAGSFYYDIAVVNPSGKARIYMTGMFNIIKHATSSYS